MALGMLADENLADYAELTGLDSVALPVTNLQLGDYIGRPARCEDPTDLAKSQFQAVLEYRRPISLIAVLFHTLSRRARYRLTVSDIGGSFAAPALQTDWLAVYPRLYRSVDLPWPAPNFWTGQPNTRDLRLYPPHLWIAPPADTRVTALKLEFDDRDNAAGYFDLGGLSIVSGWSPKFNFERGRGLSIDPRSQVDEGPSGRRFGEERTSRRKQSVEWRGLFKAEADRMLDMGMRCGITRPVIFVPDISDPGSLLREAFPATFERPPSASYLFEGLHQVPATFEEIIA